jgi:uncharacterized protein YbcV (DUF1398 family)
MVVVDEEKENLVGGNSEFHSEIHYKGITHPILGVSGENARLTVKVKKNLKIISNPTVNPMNESENEK